MPPSLGDRLSHIINAIDDIQRILRGSTQETFTDDLLLRVGTERLLEVISEASRYIPEDQKERAPNIEWRRLADLGNQLRHAYHRIEPRLIWTVVQNDLNILRDFVVRFLAGDHGLSGG